MSNRRHKLRAIVHIYPERAIAIIGGVLASTGDLSKTAKVLRVSRRTLGRYRKQLGPEKVWEAALEKMRGA
jgi:hypothetical protein